MNEPPKIVRLLPGLGRVPPLKVTLFAASPRLFSAFHSKLPALRATVIVALAGNAVENVVGVQFAVRNQADYAISVILNSSLQVALGLTPVLVLLSFVIGGAHLTLVLAPLLVVALGLTAILSTVITYDGESTWLEGLTLVGLYGIIAVSFWWG